MARSAFEADQAAASRDILYVKKVSPDAVLPTKGSEFAAGWDLASAGEGIIPARGTGIISTGLAIRVPPSTYGRIAPRSGLAVKNSIDVGAGVLDQDYNGIVGVVLFNHSDIPFLIKKGDRIAQLILEKIVQKADVVEVDSLPETKRGSGGFGSTGI
jgi:dUTP pyrophosphatase